MDVQVRQRKHISIFGDLTSLPSKCLMLRKVKQDNTTEQKYASLIKKALTPTKHDVVDLVHERRYCLCIPGCLPLLITRDGQLHPIEGNGGQEQGSKGCSKGSVLLSAFRYVQLVLHEHLRACLFPMSTFESALSAILCYQHCHGLLGITRPADCLCETHAKQVQLASGTGIRAQYSKRQ